MVKIVPDMDNMLAKDSSVDCFQIRSVADERFAKRIGTANNDVVEQIRTAIALVLNIE